MITLTVKTLDSRNHEFSVDDDITVREFKESVAERTEISVNNQRLIYCGRVLADEKLLREYDVNGKVVHLVQRPPPSVRSNHTSSRSTNSENNGSGVNVRGAPIFRAIDGMVLGAMSIPMNANNGTPQATAPSLNPSSTLCMNRITVARYMLECANNIAAYLEDPSRGLNNTAMDILAQQTMESTVLEVGISAVSDIEIPQHQMQNIVQAFQGAFSAAFRQNGISNIRVMQQVTDQNGFRVSGDDAQQSTSSPSNNNTSDVSQPQGPLTNNVIQVDNTPSTASSASSGTDSNSSNESANTPAGTQGSRQQTTSTQTLAEVVQQMRNVQTRMEPFIQQYYDILLNDPSFPEDNPTQRENSQRVFDRVSEALHYFSHAQHAISDLMLDLSTTTPRHLCCRPILVEQSAFVSSGIALPSPVIPLSQVIRAHGNNNETTGNSNTSTATPRQPTSAENQDGQPQRPSAPTPTQQQQQQNNNQQGQLPTPILSSLSRGGTPRRGILVPIRSVAVVPDRQGGPTEVILNYGNQEQSTDANRGEGGTPPPMHVARLIEAVMNSAPLHADVHVEINSPSITSGPQTNTTTTNNTTDSANNELTINIHLADPNEQPRVTTATHPTTSTQTRSTPRPHVHLTNLPGPQLRSIRPVPANMFSAFDRFLPCNSHHIRDNQPSEQTPPGVLLRNRPSQRVTLQRPPRPQSPAVQGHRVFVTPTAVRGEFSDLSGTILDTPISIFGNELTVRGLIHTTPAILNRIREGFLTNIQTTFFNGSEITEGNMLNGVNAGLQLLEIYLQPLAHRELPDYDARRSVENLVRGYLQSIFILIRDDTSNEFGERLLRETNTFIKRFFTVLLTCIGRPNSLSYLDQIIQLAVAANIFFNIPASQIQTIIHHHIDNSASDISDVREYLVIRRPAPGENMEQLILEQESQNTPMETDEMEDVARSMVVDLTEEPNIPVVNLEQLIPRPLVEEEEALPAVVIDSEPWHLNYPTQSWIPVITRDISRQRRQNAQAPFSDAYISGMSSKRRKLISEKKPPVDVPIMLSEGIRRAIHTTGLNTSITQSTPIDEITTAISSDQNVQISFKEAVKTSVQDRLQYDPDYKSDRFPNSSKYFNNNK